MNDVELTDVIAELRRRNEAVPIPLRLPTPDQLAAVESTLGITFPPDYRRYLLEASDVVLGTLEPATIADPRSPTYLPDLIEAAHEYGVPDAWLPFCEDNANFHCLLRSGQVRYWSTDGASSESWASLAHWIQSVWIEENA